MSKNKLTKAQNKWMDALIKQASEKLKNRYHFGFSRIAKSFSGMERTARKYNTPGVRMSNGKKIKA